jgi:two-component system, cell cycle response regulator
MAQRILVIETSHPVVAALRRFLRGGGFEIQVASPGAPLGSVDLSGFAVAAVRASAPDAPRVLEALRAADPALPVVLLLDEEEEPAGRLPADGALVAPLTRTAVVSLLGALARARAEAGRARELERELASRPVALQDYEFFKKLLLVEVKRSRRYHYPVSLALLAVDGWKERATSLDEQQRSSLLGEVLALVAGGVRDIDLPLLYDGERLLVFMPHTDALGARTVAQRLVRRARTHPAGITASVGVSTFDGEGTMSFSTLVRGAAEALLEAQGRGGDQAEQGTGKPRQERAPSA